MMTYQHRFLRVHCKKGRDDVLDEIAAGGIYFLPTLFFYYRGIPHKFLTCSRIANALHGRYDPLGFFFTYKFTIIFAVTSLAQMTAEV